MRHGRPTRAHARTHARLPADVRAQPALTYARPMADVSAAAATAQVIEATLKDAELEWESPESGSYVVKLPGTRKLSTTCSLI